MDRQNANRSVRRNFDRLAWIALEVPCLNPCYATIETAYQQPVARDDTLAYGPAVGRHEGSQFDATLRYFNNRIARTISCDHQYPIVAKNRAVRDWLLLKNRVPFITVRCGGDRKVDYHLCAVWPGPDRS